MVLDVLRKIMKIINDKGGENPVVLDMRRTPIPTEYFVIVTANSYTHMRAMRDELVDFIKSSGIPIIYYDRGDQYEWSLIDIGDIVIHIFTEKGREFYDLEGLWFDAERVRL